MYCAKVVLYRNLLLLPVSQVPMECAGGHKWFPTRNKWKTVRDTLGWGETDRGFSIIRDTPPRSHQHTQSEWKNGGEKVTCFIFLKCYVFVAFFSIKVNNCSVNIDSSIQQPQTVSCVTVNIRIIGNFHIITKVVSLCGVTLCQLV